MSDASRITSQRYERPYRPRAVALGNALGRAAERAGARIRLDEASLVAAARRATGLEGSVDAPWRESLRRLLDSMEREAGLHTLGRLIARQKLVGALSNRLRADWLRDLHPEIEATPVAAPIFIAGLQRTGTTVLQRLLSLDPALRALPSWEALNPAPILDPRHPRDDGRPDGRLAQARLAEKALRYLAPDFFAIHPVEAESPEEDVLLLDLCFQGTTPESIHRVPSFAAWLESQDAVPAYRDFRRWIQLLLWRRPGRWLGKTPHHLEFLDALFEVFPDAKIIQTHRDPARVTASFCSMISHARGLSSDRVDPREVGAHWSRKQLRMVTRGMATRDRMGEGAFIDVHYADLLADPLKQVRRIYEFLELPLADPTERAMQAWIAGHPQHRHGRHRYRLADFGLDRTVLDRDFGGYCERFGVATESEEEDR
ncbi:MAG: sulfotransferase family protein [Myxococcota bacterium]